MPQPKVIRIDGVIGTGLDEVSAQSVREQLPTNGTDPVHFDIHSEGGSVFEGFAIHDLVAAYRGPKTGAVSSSAFSIASYVAMAIDELEISPNGYMMLHNPYAKVEGDDETMAKQAELLGQLKNSMVTAYANRSGKPVEEIKAILKDETYFNADQCVQMGFAKRITGQPIIGREFARTSTMPHGVVAALFGAGSGGEKRDSKKGHTMAESQPVAATLEEIEAAFPKAKSDFVIKCLKKKMPMASVATAAVEELMAENAQLQARIQAMEQEMTKAKAMDPAEVIEEMTEEEPAEEAKAKGVKAVAKAKTSGPSASVKWQSAIQSALPDCKGNKMKAVALASRNNPGLREAMLAEVNAR